MPLELVVACTILCDVHGADTALDTLGHREETVFLGLVDELLAGEMQHRVQAIGLVGHGDCNVQNKCDLILRGDFNHPSWRHIP